MNAEMNAELYSGLLWPGLLWPELLWHGLLWISVTWPLLLAIPALHSRLPWPRHLAIIPALVLTIMSLTVMPGQTTLELPWLLFGTGFAINADSRWILGMSVIIWLMAASFTRPVNQEPAVHKQSTTLFLLTLSGSLGVILSTELVGFFSFSSLMAYAFYGFFIRPGHEQAHEQTQAQVKAADAGRLYLRFFIVADLALFEALLLAAAATGDLRYELVRQMIVVDSAASFYLWMVLLGFIIKAGIWPFQLWLLASFRSASRSGAIVLSGVPVVMGLLGLIRWLPLGEANFYASGLVIQAVAVAGLVYLGVKLFRFTSLKDLPALLTLFLSGLFLLAVGTGLGNSSLWQQFSYLSYPVIACLGIFLMALSITVNRLQRIQPQVDIESVQEEISDTTERWDKRCQTWVDNLFSTVLLQWSNLWKNAWLKLQLYYLRQKQPFEHWKQSGFSVTGWGFRITLFLLSGLALAWLAG